MLSSKVEDGGMSSNFGNTLQEKEKSQNLIPDGEARKTKSDKGLLIHTFLVQKY